MDDCFFIFITIFYGISVFYLIKDNAKKDKLLND